MTKRKGVNGKAKGSTFERRVAKYLTTWLTEHNIDGEFTRVPSSGGLRWKQNDSVVGDITLSSPTHETLCTFECKNQEKWSLWKLFGYHTVPANPKGPSTLQGFWGQACSDAARTETKFPTLIMTKNHRPIILVIPENINVVLAHRNELLDIGIRKRFVLHPDIKGTQYNDVIIVPFLKFLDIVDPQLLLEKK